MCRFLEVPLRKTIVRVWEAHTVPANSVKRVIGVLTEPMRKEFNIKAKAEDNLIILRTIHEMVIDPVLGVISDGFQSYFKG